MTQTFTICFVYHEDPTPDAVAMASLWIAQGDRREDPKLPDEKDGWSKIVGPLEFSTADMICSSLEAFFTKNGLDIKSEMVAD